MNSLEWIIVVDAVIIAVLLFWWIYHRSMRVAYTNLLILVHISELFRQDVPLTRVFPDVVELLKEPVSSVKSGALLIFSTEKNPRFLATSDLTEKDFSSFGLPKNTFDELKKQKTIVRHKIAKGLVTIFPLQVQSNVVGALVLVHSRKRTTTLQHQFLESAANQISIEFEDRLLQTRLDAFTKGLSLVEYSYEKIVDNLPSGIVAIDPHGRILLWNKMMQDLTGISSPGAIGKSYGAIMGETRFIQKFLQELVKSNLLTSIQKYKFSLKGKKSLVLEITGYPLYDMQNNVIAYVVMHRDLTNELLLQKKLQQTQIDARSILEKKIAFATKELTVANKELVKLNKLKSDFISTVSHELKTPLTSIKGYVNLLGVGKFGKLTKKQQDAVEVVESQANRLNELITDILDLSRMESGKTDIDLESVSVDVLVKDAIQSVEMQAKQRHIRINKNINIEESLTVDKTKITQVLVNLLSNAIKFSPEKGAVEIIARKYKTVYIFEVKDEGVGIEKDKLENIFEPFFQVQDHMTRNVSGTGLGLTIVKRIVDMHKGEVKVTSVPGKGTTFLIALPVLEQP